MTDLLAAVTPIPDPVVFCVPGDPRGKGRHKTRVLGDKLVPSKKRPGQMVKRYITQEYTDKETAAYEAEVKLYARQAMQGRTPFEGPVHLELVIYCPIMPSWTKRKRLAAIAGELLPVCKPDGDNVLKAIKDAMNEVVYGDDKQVCSFVVRKEYSENPRVAVGVASAEVGEPNQRNTVNGCRWWLDKLHGAGLLPHKAHEILAAGLTLYEKSVGDQHLGEVTKNLLPEQSAIV